VLKFRVTAFMLLLCCGRLEFKLPRSVIKMDLKEIDRGEFWFKKICRSLVILKFSRPVICVRFASESNRPLPGIAPVAMQQGRHFAKVVKNDLDQKPRPEFRYIDKGQMATIGQSCAIAEMGKYRLTGFPAWIAWLVVHIYFLTGFRNRLFVIFSWTWSFLSFRRGARLILQKNWRFYGSGDDSLKAVELTADPNLLELSPSQPEPT